MYKVKMGIIYPGDVSELDSIDLDEINLLDFMDIIKEMLDELRENKEGELVIVPFEEKKDVQKE